MTEDVWRTYFAEMGGQGAVIVFNDGIAGRINASPLVHAMKVRLPVKAPRADGLPTRAESEALAALDEQLAGLITNHGGEYLGRVTNNGARWMLALIPPEAVALEAALQAAAGGAGYEAEIHTGDDPGKAVYWHDLYPSEDDRQVMVDMEVQAVMRDRGDVPEKPRQISHWAYFREEAAAQRFAAWAGENGYRDIALTAPETAGASLWRVQLFHQGTLQLQDISGHSVALGRQARQTGGQYDGWEAPVTL